MALHEGNPTIDPYQQEHNDLFKAILNNEPYMEAERGAKSTMTAIMGRMAGWSGKLMLWDEAIESKWRLARNSRRWTSSRPSCPTPTGFINCRPRVSIIRSSPIQPATFTRQVNTRHRPQHPRGMKDSRWWCVAEPPR